MDVKQLVGLLLAGVVLAALVAVGVVLGRLELEMIYTLSLIVVIGVVAALIVAAAALPIWAHKGGPQDRERIIKETKHTIKDGRREPRIITLQGARSGFDAMYPEMLRGAMGWRSSPLAGQRHAVTDQTSGGELVDGEVEETDLGDENAWVGPIRR